MKNHISFSEIKDYNSCSYMHKLKYIDEIDLFDGNEFLCFGKALHKISERQAKKEKYDNWEEIFEYEFLKELNELKTKNSTITLKPQLISEMREQGKSLCTKIVPSLLNTFGEYEVVGIEENLYESINLETIKKINFKGFIDLVIKTKDDEINIIDLKTCSWGWDGRKKGDKMTTYQLTFYKYFYAQKYNFDLEKIETYFTLLKRTAKKDPIETFRVTSGKKKIENSLIFLKNVVNNIQSGKYWKNKSNCEYCVYNNSPFCVK